MNRITKTLLGAVLALALIITVFVPLDTVTARADGDKESVHILYRTTDGELKAIWNFEVEKDTGKDVPAEIMTGYDPEGIIGTIEDLNNIRGIIVLKFRPDRDTETAPEDPEAFIKTLTKIDTFQTSTAFGNLWTFDDPSGEFDWGGSLLLKADTRFLVQKITIENAPQTLKVGKSVKLKATLEPEDALTRELKWKVSNKKYAKITKTGKLTALKAGKGKTVKVTATATDGTGCKVTIKVKIK